MSPMELLSVVSSGDSPVHSAAPPPHPSLRSLRQFPPNAATLGRGLLHALTTTRGGTLPSALLVAPFGAMLAAIGSLWFTMARCDGAFSLPGWLRPAAAVPLVLLDNFCAV